MPQSKALHPLFFLHQTRKDQKYMKTCFELYKAKKFDQLQKTLKTKKHSKQGFLVFTFSINF